MTANSSSARHGLHWREWACELVGTSILLLGGLSAVCLDFSDGSPVASVIHSHSWRLLLTGFLFAGSGFLVTISPLGRLSGAHLNPAVTVAFWRRGHVHIHDLFGYIGAQIVGAFAGAALVRWWWGARARQVNLGVTLPGHGASAPEAAVIEGFMTLLLVGGILLMVSFRRTAQWTPYFVWVLVALLVWQGAPFTGTSLNPARSLGPAVLRPDTTTLWVYFVGPLAGAIVAAWVIDVLPGVETLTAKLYHDHRYPSTLASSLPVAPTRHG